MQPFVKWAGGKRQLIPMILERLPKTYNEYYEPFIGGGALLLELQPKKAFVGDINNELVGIYKNVRDHVEELMSILDELTVEYNESSDKKELFYQKREAFNQKLLNGENDVETSALFLFMNKTCFNGLYRVNSKGLFNVPFNGRNSLKIYEKENLIKISEYLKSVSVEVRDFEETCKNAKAGDFVFFDSPYAPLKPDSFESYTKEGFSLDEHIRLANLYKELSARGVYCMLTNHNTELIRDLYKDYKIEVVPVKRMINSDVNNRVGEEVIITNYE
ncbi:MAG: DNA adenine methylase [Erysipelotrichaceae bacterium]|nr:DNA adenine methylase [Erysipelotrichaceae bacterium]